MLSLILAAALCAATDPNDTTQPERDVKPGYIHVGLEVNGQAPWIELREGPDRSSKLIHNLGFANREVYEHAKAFHMHRVIVGGIFIRHGAWWNCLYVESKASITLVPEPPPQPGNPA